MPEQTNTSAKLWLMQKQVTRATSLHKTYAMGGTNKLAQDVQRRIFGFMESM
jgi:hypothetical protein